MRVRVEARAGYYAARDFAHTSRGDRETQLQEQLFAAVSATDLPVFVRGAFFRLAADRYRASAVQAAAELERIAQVSYDAGERGILELLDGLRTAATARVRQSALDYAVRQAELELEFVSGWEIP